MISSSRLRSFESDLYDILDYELPPYHQIVSVKASAVGYDDVKLSIVIHIGNNAIPDREGCGRIVKQYIDNIFYDYKEFDEVHFTIYFK